MAASPPRFFSWRWDTDHPAQRLIDQEVRDHTDFSKISIIPPKEELLGQLWPQLGLMKNKINGDKYENISEYLATHFSLLREDCTQALREAVQSLHNNYLLERQDVQVYRGVRLDFVECGKFGTEYKVYVPQCSMRSEENTASKFLMEGSLLCMSNDNFQTVLWVTPVTQRTSFDRNYVHVRCLDHISEGTLEFQKVYTMVESSAYFEAYCHVLENLKKFQLLSLPFKEHFLYLDPQVKAPDYLCQDCDGSFLSSVDPYSVSFQVCASVFPLLQDWAELRSSLDPSQLKAVKHGITKRLALIQGPPGTGKTFVGKMIVKILLSNKGGRKDTGTFASTWKGILPNPNPDRLDFSNVEESVEESPLLVLCYTNHALDQFLEGIYEFEKSLIRYGGRSTSSKLIDCSVKEWVRKEKQGSLRSKWNSYRALLRRGDRLRDQISRCYALMHLEYVTIEPLREVATREQVENLFSCGSNAKIVPLWLQGLDLPSARQHLSEGSLSRRKDLSRSARCTEIMDIQKDGDGISAPFFEDDPYVWALDKSSRQALHTTWLTRIRNRTKEQLLELSREFKVLCSSKARMNEEVHSSVLRRAKVIGMTTTAASRCHDILMQVKPRVVVVEEAAEVLEAHIIGCLTPFTEHLILIGDHLQLRPSVAINNLATDYHLDVSLFERLISGGVEHVTLEYQRRMRPNISRLLRCFYPKLKDHDCVFSQKNVEGIKDNVFFLNHRSEEKRIVDSKSKINLDECHFVAGLYLYILKQGCYGIQDVTILTMYRAQMELIKNTLSKKLEELLSSSNIVPDVLTDPHSAQVACVDDYQGEESEIVILSLVRNTFPGKDMESIGFLENPNRVCVALSRARKGLYIFGNADLLASKSKLWQIILDSLRECDSVGNHLTLVCPNHFETETKIYNANGFHKVVEGGCSQRCQHTLDCGHACPKTCHPGDHRNIICLEQCSHTLTCGHLCLRACHSGSHDKIACPKRCNKELPCGHRCLQKCHKISRCPPCRQKVSKRHPQCGHRVLIPCSLQMGFQCEEQCSAVLDCGHRCPNKCGVECATECLQMGQKKLPCGHFAAVPCYQAPDSVICQEVCGQSRKPHCNHLCQGKCSSCRMNNAHPDCSQMCERMLPCGHHCKSLCFQSCAPCGETCQNSCSHGQCPKRCGEPCERCQEPCRWSCEHYSCNLKCYEVCSRPRCDKKCPKVLNCGHDCIGLCGEPCPTKCRTCHPDTMEMFFNSPIKNVGDSARFVQLSDCGHLALFNELDDFMDRNPDEPTEKWLKTCPLCDTPIRRTIRYKSITNSMLRKLEEVKIQIAEENFWASKKLRRDNVEREKG